MSTRALQQVDMSGRPGNRLVDLRSRQHQPTAADVDDFDSELFGITIDNTAETVTIGARRIKRQQPDDYSPAALVINVAENTLNLSAVNFGVLTEVDATVWLNYNLETEIGIYSWTEGVDSAVRLYVVTATKDGTDYSAVLKRIMRPGDVDIEAVWLDYVAPV